MWYMWYSAINSDLFHKTCIAVNRSNQASNSKNLKSFFKKFKKENDRYSSVKLLQFPWIIN